MSRSGYGYDGADSQEEQWALIRSAGALNSALKGKRGQGFLREMLSALDAMPVKELHANILVEDGCVCAMGAVAVARGVDVSEVDPEESEEVAKALNISDALARYVAYLNDEHAHSQETPEARWSRMRFWVAGVLLAEQIRGGM